MEGSMADAIRDALAELVAVRDLKDRAHRLADEFTLPANASGDQLRAAQERMRTEHNRLMREANAREPAAWAAARNALGVPDRVTAADPQRNGGESL
jgi:hypothetical protein